MRGRRTLERFFAERIEERRTKAGADMFTQFCQATDDEGQRFSDQDIVDHMIFLLMAAHDTTTSSLTSMLYHLAKSPNWQERLRAECLATGEEPLDWTRKDALPETDWAFKEALRLHPPVPFISRRSLRADTVGSVEVPANAGIGVCSLITHFLEQYWSEAQALRPRPLLQRASRRQTAQPPLLPPSAAEPTCA